MTAFFVGQPVNFLQAKRRQFGIDYRSVPATVTDIKLQADGYVIVKHRDRHTCVKVSLVTPTDQPSVLTKVVAAMAEGARP